MNTSELVKRVSGFQSGLSSDLDKFGGYLRCNVCGRIEQMKPGDAGYYTTHGWKTHCGYTMAWVTDNERRDSHFREGYKDIVNAIAKARRGISAVALTKVTGYSTAYILKICRDADGVDVHWSWSKEAPRRKLFYPLT